MHCAYLPRGKGSTNETSSKCMKNTNEIARQRIDFLRTVPIRTTTAACVLPEYTWSRPDSLFFPSGRKAGLALDCGPPLNILLTPSVEKCWSRYSSIVLCPVIWELFPMKPFKSHLVHADTISTRSAGACTGLPHLCASATPKELGSTREATETSGHNRAIRKELVSIVWLYFAVQKSFGAILRQDIIGAGALSNQYCIAAWSTEAAPGIWEASTCHLPYDTFLSHILINVTRLKHRIQASSNMTHEVKVWFGCLGPHEPNLSLCHVETGVILDRTQCKHTGKA